MHGGTEYGRDLGFERGLELIAHASFAARRQCLHAFGALGCGWCFIQFGLGDAQ